MLPFLLFCTPLHSQGDYNCAFTEFASFLTSTELALVEAELSFIVSVDIMVFAQGDKSTYCEDELVIVVKAFCDYVLLYFCVYYNVDGFLFIKFTFDVMLGIVGA